MESSAQSEARDRAVKRVLVVEGVANVVALTTKLVVGLATGSMAILADAVHSVTDVANNVVALIVMHFAAKPADRGHPYGHRKFETLAVFVLATLLTVLAIEIALHAIRSGSREVMPSGVGLVAMIALLIMQCAIALWEARRARALESDLLHADASHTLADVFVTFVAIAGWQLSAHGHGWIDTAMTIVVAIVVLWFAFGLFKRVVPVLVDENAHDPEELRDAVSSVDGVKDVRTVRSRWIGSEASIDVTVTVSPRLPTEDSHAIADQVESELRAKFHAAIVNVHVEPH